MIKRFFCILFLLGLVLTAWSQEAQMVAIAEVEYNQRYVTQWEAQDIGNIIFRQFAFTKGIEVVDSEILSSVMTGQGVKAGTRIDGDIALKVGSASATNYIVQPTLSKQQGNLFLSMVMFNAKTGHRAGLYNLALVNEYDIAWDVLNAVNYLVDKIFFKERFSEIISLDTHENPSFLKSAYLNIFAGYSATLGEGRQSYQAAFNWGAEVIFASIGTSWIELPLSTELMLYNLDSLTASLPGYYNMAVTVKTGPSFLFSEYAALNLLAGGGLNIFFEGSGGVYSDFCLDISADLRLLFTYNWGLSFDLSYKQFTLNINRNPLLVPILNIALESVWKL